MSIHGDFQSLNDRARQVFMHIVENFLETGEPTGSRTLSRSIEASAATIRNDMADLEYLGLLEAPHVSAGRMPSEMGLRFFVDGIMETGSLNETERAAFEEGCLDQGTSATKTFERASSMLSKLSSCAGLVVAPVKSQKSIRHIEFVQLDPARAMVIIVPDDGMVENRVIDVPQGITSDILKQAGAFLSEKLYGKTFEQMQNAITEEMTARRSEMGLLTQKVIEAGLAIQLDDGKLIVRGSSNLVRGSTDTQNIERLKFLMEQLEAKETISKLLDEATDANGVKIYIGSENKIFEGSGHSLILSPYMNGHNAIVGAIGVIGPTRLNYGKIIPSVNCMADILTRRMRDFSG
ncbi:MAG: heat-inducible transcriptional repressor HrcA [Alphaproteobacteria bacterium]|nr:heat-inducible transcriptional repressor HrcA [Alphaproteobacteria bacterium]